MSIRVVAVEEGAATGSSFPGSSVRHGTPSGHRKHQLLNERPCDACYRAKQDYDKRRREAPERTRLSRLQATAQGRAWRALAHNYPDEYRALYAAFKAELMAEHHAAKSTEAAS